MASPAYALPVEDFRNAESRSETTVFGYPVATARSEFPTITSIVGSQAWQDSITPVSIPSSLENTLRRYFTEPNR